MPTKDTAELSVCNPKLGSRATVQEGVVRQHSVQEASERVEYLKRSTVPVHEHDWNSVTRGVLEVQRVPSGTQAVIRKHDRLPLQ
jgi:hypothetical protein